MFTGMGRRPSTVQHLKIAATRDGKLVAIDHEGTSTASMSSDSLYPITVATIAAYACPNVVARDKRVRLNIPPIAHMRGPGIAEGKAALEQTVTDPGSGRVANATLGDYLVAVNADVPAWTSFRGRARSRQPRRRKGHRGGRPGRSRRRDRQRRLPRHRPAHSLVADHHRPASLAQLPAPLF
jgi:CO/xanthine dehydrogenase Mo-binding subunit